MGDADTASLLDRIYRDEIGHVAYGLKWFRRWKNPRKAIGRRFCRQLKFPLSPQRAKGFTLNIEGRRAAGLDADFIAELNVYSPIEGPHPERVCFQSVCRRVTSRRARLHAEETPGDAGRRPGEPAAIPLSAG